MDAPHTTSPRTARFWAWLPAGLLGAMLLGLGSMAYVAIDDPGFALEPNYYDKALRWDQSQAQARQSQALGYRLELNRQLVLERGGVQVELALLDRAGRPVSGARVALEAFPNAAASRIEHLELQEAGPGVYRGALRRGSVGLWELRCQVKHAGGVYQTVLRRDVAKVPAA
jgi:nitrogen fixation protein FixH